MKLNVRGQFTPRLARNSKIKLAQTTICLRELGLPDACIVMKLKTSLLECAELHNAPRRGTLCYRFLFGLRLKTVCGECIQRGNVQTAILSVFDEYALDRHLLPSIPRRVKDINTQQSVP